jgi:hypothetical protein
MIFLVERYLADADPRMLGKLPQRLETATAQLRARGTEITYLDSTFLPQEESCFCRFEARSEDAVELANRMADVHYSRISVAILLAAEP